MLQSTGVIFVRLAAVVWDFALLLEINTLATAQDYVVILNLLSYFQIRSEQHHWENSKKMLIP